MWRHARIAKTNKPMETMRIVSPKKSSVGPPTGTSTAPATATAYALLPEQAAASAAVIEKLNVPAELGVPVIAPVAPLRIRPPGSAPLDTENVYGAVPPDAETV